MRATSALFLLLASACQPHPETSNVEKVTYPTARRDPSAVDTYFGTSFYTLDTSGASPLITNKKVVLKNDYIHHVIDIYHI